MPTNYPTSADTFERPSTADGGTRYLADITRYDLVDDIQDAVEAMQARFGPPASTTAFTASGTGVSAVEFRVGALHQLVISLTDVEITVGNTTGVSFGGVQLGSFTSVGSIAIKDLITDISIAFDNAGNNTPIDSADGGDFSMGTTAPTDGTLTTTDISFLASTSIDPLSGTMVGTRDAWANVAASPDLYFNMLIDDADVGDGASDILELTGSIYIEYIDYTAYQTA